MDSVIGSNFKTRLQAFLDGETLTMLLKKIYQKSETTFEWRVSLSLALVLACPEEVKTPEEQGIQRRKLVYTTEDEDKLESKCRKGSEYLKKMISQFLSHVYCLLWSALLNSSLLSRV